MNSPRRPNRVKSGSRWTRADQGVCPTKSKTGLAADECRSTPMGRIKASVFIGVYRRLGNEVEG